MREFKYRRTGLHIFTGIFFIIIGMCFVTFFISIVVAGANPEILLLILPFVLWIWSGCYNLFINRRNYIEFDGNMIAIDRTALIPRVTFSTNDISVATKVGSKIRIGLKSGKEVELLLDSITVFDIDELMKILKIND